MRPIYLLSAAASLEQETQGDEGKGDEGNNGR